MPPRGSPTTERAVSSEGDAPLHVTLTSGTTFAYAGATLSGFIAERGAVKRRGTAILAGKAFSQVVIAATKPRVAPPYAKGGALCGLCRAPRSLASNGAGGGVLKREAAQSV